MPPATKTPLPTYDQALALVLERAPVLTAEPAELSATLGRVLRQEVRADRDQPPFDRSAMDGFAVRSAEVVTENTYPIAGVVAAGADPSAFQSPMPAGAVLSIATGAPLPAGADAVIPIEQCQVDKDRVRFDRRDIQPWQNVHRRGVDAGQGQLVLAPGRRLTPYHLGIAAAMGATTLSVTRRPRITVLTTGDEVRPPETATADLSPSQIRNSNGPMLLALLTALGAAGGPGGPAIHHEHVVDDPEVTLAAAREALSRSNLVITVGGVSVGERDHLPRAWHHLGLETILHGVNIQPGKPVFVARPPEPDDAKMVIGLPGNPVSVLCCAHLFVWPVLRRMAGAAPDEVSLPWRPVRLAAPAKGSAKRMVFRGARLEPDSQATVIPWHGSGDLAHTAGIDGFLRLPLQDEPVDAGVVLPFLPAIGR